MRQHSHSCVRLVCRDRCTCVDVRAVLLLLLTVSAAAALPCNFTSTEEAVEFCKQYEDLYQAIYDDLAVWKDTGIDEALMRRAVMAHTVLGRQQKGVQLGFSGGKAYVIVGDLEQSMKGWIGHHANILFTYMQVMQELEWLFGTAIPDVEFVIASGDKPMVLKQDRVKQYYEPLVNKTFSIKADPRDRQIPAATASTDTAATASTTPGNNRQYRHRRRLRSSSSAVPGRAQQAAEETAGSGAGSGGKRELQSEGMEIALDSHSQRRKRRKRRKDRGGGAGGGKGADGDSQLAGAQRGQVQRGKWTYITGGVHPWRQGDKPRSLPLALGSDARDVVPGALGKVIHSTHSQAKRRSLRPRLKEIFMNLPLPDFGTPIPVFRFCSSPAHADIRQPIFHFYTKKYDQRFLRKIANITAAYPWESKKPILFGRFAHYMRQIHPYVPETFRWGANHTNICQRESRDSALCWARQHMFDVAAAFPDLMDINSKPKIGLSAHAQYKYLVHVDGQGLSSRLDQLLPLGSVVFKEESGYTTFYHHLLKPYTHYIPFWEQDPLDALDRIPWAKAHDKEARDIAKAGQDFAVRYLNKRARTCYWFKLLSEFSKLLKYRPASGAGAMKRTWIPVQEYFEKVAMKWENGARWTPQIECC